MQKHLVQSSETCVGQLAVVLSQRVQRQTWIVEDHDPPLLFLKHRAQAVGHNSFPCLNPKGIASITILMWAKCRTHIKKKYSQPTQGTCRFSEEKLADQPLHSKSSHVLENPLHRFSRHCKQGPKFSAQSVFGQAQLEKAKACNVSEQAHDATAKHCGEDGRRQPSAWRMANCSCPQVLLSAKVVHGWLLCEQ